MSAGRLRSYLADRREAARDVRAAGRRSSAAAERGAWTPDMAQAAIDATERQQAARRGEGPAFRGAQAHAAGRRAARHAAARAAAKTVPS